MANEGKAPFDKGDEAYRILRGNGKPGLEREFVELAIRVKAMADEVRKLPSVFDGLYREDEKIIHSLATVRDELEGRIGELERRCEEVYHWKKSHSEKKNLWKRRRWEITTIVLSAILGPGSAILINWMLG